jgi:cytochrome c-type biogenesis protein CcmH/NrfG
MWKNPVVTAVAGILLGFFIGFLVGQGRPAEPLPGMSNPHAGVAGAPALNGAPVAPPEGGRTLGTADPKLMEQARELESHLTRDPNNYTLLVQMGNVEYDMGNFDNAKGYYERARAIKDDSPDLLTDLGVCYRETKDPRKAVELFDKASSLAPDHWQSRYNAAVVRLFDLNDVEGAKRDLDQLKSGGAVPAADHANLEALEKEIARRLK